MDTTGRQEEFGAGPWAAVVAAILLAVTVGSSFLHANPQAPMHPVAIHASRSGNQ